MTVAREWITARAAAALARRDLSRIYAWIREGRLTTREDDDGTLHVLTTDVLELEARMRRRRNNTTRRTTPAK